MVIGRKIAYNVLVSSVSKVFSTILALVSIGLITRYLGRNGFGEYATVLAFLSFFSAIADLGLYSTTTREISRPKADEEKIIGNIFSLRIAISSAVLIVAPVIVAFLPYPEEVKKAILIIAASFLFSSTYQLLNGVFQKNLAMDKVAISELIGKVAQVFVVFISIRLRLDFLWIISSIFFNMFVSFLLVYFFSKKYISFKLRFDFDYWKKFLKEAYPLGIAALIGFVYLKIDTILLSLMKESSDVGIYNAAYKIIENISFFPAMIIGLIFPIMSKSIFSDRKRFTDISNKTYKVFWVFIIPLIVGTMFLSDGIISLVGGGGFFQSGLVLKILIFALGFIFFGNFFNFILIAGGKQKKLMVIMFFAAIFNVLANWFFIPQYSYLAAATISVLTEMFVTIAAFYIIKKEFLYRPKAEKFWNIVAAGIIMAVFLFTFKNINFFILAFLGVLVYLIFLWLFGGIKTEEITSIISKKGEDGYAKNA